MRRAHALGDVAGSESLARHQVGRQRLVDQRRAASERSVIVRHRIECVVVDVDQLCRILGDIAVARHYAGDRVAAKPHLVLRQRRHPGRQQALDRRRHFERGGPLVDLVAGYHCDHAGQRFCRGQVETDDARMGVRRAHEAGVQRARHRDVVDKGAGAAQQAEILLARQWSADLRELAALGIFGSGDAHAGSPSRSARAAFLIARTMLP